MSADLFSLARNETAALPRLARLAILSCALTLAACAGVTPANHQPELRRVNYHMSEPAAGAFNQRQGSVWWTLHAW